MIDCDPTTFVQAITLQCFPCIVSYVPMGLRLFCFLGCRCMQIAGWKMCVSCLPGNRPGGGLFFVFVEFALFRVIIGKFKHGMTPANRLLYRPVRPAQPRHLTSHSISPFSERPKSISIFSTHSSLCPPYFLIPVISQLVRLLWGCLGKVYR